MSMNQSQRRRYLLQMLLQEQERYREMTIPADEAGQKRLLRALMNVREAAPVPPETLRVQDAYLQEEIARAGVTSAEELPPLAPGLYLWQGDITTLRCGAIVNAANSGMTGCYHPNHACIDNCIHTFAGMQLRQACADMMARQGHEEPAGRAKITPAFNLPCDYVLHTVGPIIGDRVHPEDEALLASCYRSCLELAQAHGVESVAFCCISTGMFRFPNRRAAEIAVSTIRQYRQQTGSLMKVIFNVFKDEDYAIYRELLAGD